ncbi:FAD-dependent oxidoreductase [uncultured Roseivirga sp.]|uniref:FAD-dependent oxidoreductase n=2 Tax=Roseivirga TaxID=290180 RepID=UPI0032B22584|tara:strand:- start:50332 stop:51522 length:1191 start_codon:yes stop_codon:yes gene_type:complete
MSIEKYEVIVIGGGAMGLASAYYLGKRKVKSLVLEQYEFLNQQGSSAGVSRQFRIPYPQEYMVQMALDSMPYWDELQSHAQSVLLDKVGTLWFGDPTVQSTEGNINEAKKAMDALNVPYESLTSSQIESQYQFKNLPDSYEGIFQADGASIDFRATIETLLDQCHNNSYISLKQQSPVIHIQPEGSGFMVSTPTAKFLTEKLILTPGPFVNDVINLLNFSIEATYWNMASAYFKKTENSIQYPTWFVFQNPEGTNGNQFYGFPEVYWDNPEYIRVAPDFVMHPLDDPSQRTFIPNPQELAYTSQWVKDHMTGLAPEPLFTSTCLVALSKIPNKELIIDFAPNYVDNYKNVVIYATGWAAKFTPYLGKVLVDLSLDGHTSIDLSPFKMGDQFFKALK